jgi:hypothetical protein
MMNTRTGHIRFISACACACACARARLTRTHVHVHTMPVRGESECAQSCSCVSAMLFQKGLACRCGVRIGWNWHQMFRGVLLFIPQVVLMAYMCLLQLLPRSARCYFPCGKFSPLSTRGDASGNHAADLSNRVAIVTGANSGVGLVCPS